ncbi:MAG UNVERIFIED_CONTAM: hypothetical protein LVR18_36530 [Planctomycetaceae bacterium]
MPILIANYELMTRDLAEMSEEEQPKFDLLVLDEAQRIKNRESNTALTARSDQAASQLGIDRDTRLRIVLRNWGPCLSLWR